VGDDEGQLQVVSFAEPPDPYIFNAQVAGKSRHACPAIAADGFAVRDLGGDADAAPDAGRGSAMILDLRYKNAVIYSLDVDTFLDANGDGVGDLQGLVRRLDYLEFLGVDAVWLAPFQPSPMRDNGYDVRDHYGVDPRYGSSGDFVELMHQAHQRGIKVLIDLVVNHTSDEHPWFQQARSDPASPYRDWYVWSKRRPRDWNQGMVFPGGQDRIWSYDRRARQYYYHRFYDFQPDLNMDTGVPGPSPSGQSARSLRPGRAVRASRVGAGAEETWKIVNEPLDLTPRRASTLPGQTSGLLNQKLQRTPI
jgi:hypothetical protein